MQRPAAPVCGVLGLFCRLDLDKKLQVIADARYTSKHALVLQAVEDLVTAESKTERVLESVERTLERGGSLPGSKTRDDVPRP